MGNQCAGLKDKAQFECIERARGKKKQTGTILDNDVRLSEDQMSRIAEYHERFLKNSNPSAQLFNFDEDLKGINKGYETEKDQLMYPTLNSNPKSLENTSERRGRINNLSNGEAGCPDNKERKKKRRRREANRNRVSECDGNVKIDLVIAKKSQELEDGNDFDEPASTRQRYEAYPDLSDNCDSFGDPNFNKYDYAELINNKVKIKSIRPIEDAIQSNVPNESLNEDNYAPNYDDQYKINGYITPNLGSARSNNHNKYNSYEDSIEIPENERELIELNNQIVNEARSFVLDSKNSSNKKKDLDYEPSNRVLYTEENAECSFQNPGLEKHEYQRRIATQSSNQDDNIDDYDNYSFLKSNNENAFYSKLSKASNNNLITIIDTKSNLKVVDTSAIELNQSHDYDEFDDILNSLNKGFMQRKTKKANTKAKS